MGTTLTGLQVGSTYSGLLKTTDNAIISGVLRVITDGLGNDTALSVSSAGVKSSGTLEVTGVATLTAQPILSALTASSAVATDASKGLVSVTNTGTGSNVLATSPTLVTPILGTPTSGNLANCTGYVGTSALVTVGALNSGSIVSGFGSINVGANSITGGALSGTTLAASGNVYSGNDGFPVGSGITDGWYAGPGGVMVLSMDGTNSYMRRRTSDGNLLAFYRDTTNVGSISVTATASAYNTSSDARLKHAITEVDHAKVRAIVNDIRIRDYLWNANDRPGLGPIAQELALVHPLLIEIGAVTPGDGTPVDYAAWQAQRDRKARGRARSERNEAAKTAHKLAVRQAQEQAASVPEPVLESDPEDAEQDFVQWQVDLSKLMPFILDYAQQESKRLDALVARVAALEARPPAPRA